MGGRALHVPIAASTQLGNTIAVARHAPTTEHDCNPNGGVAPEENQLGSLV